ncbi:MAG: hypothetical protein ACLKAN_12565 [Alkaliphilus sp.]
MENLFASKKYRKTLSVITLGGFYEKTAYKVSPGSALDKGHVV